METQVKKELLNHCLENSSSRFATQHFNEQNIFDTFVIQVFPMS